MLVSDLQNQFPTLRSRPIENDHAWLVAKVVDLNLPRDIRGTNFEMRVWGTLQKALAASTPNSTWHTRRRFLEMRRLEGLEAAKRGKRVTQERFPPGRILPQTRRRSSMEVHATAAAAGLSCSVPQTG